MWAADELRRRAGPNKFNLDESRLRSSVRLVVEEFGLDRVLSAIDSDVTQKSPTDIRRVLGLMAA